MNKREIRDRDRYGSPKPEEKFGDRARDNRRLKAQKEAMWDERQRQKWLQLDEAIAKHERESRLAELRDTKVYQSW